MSTVIQLLRGCQVRDGLYEQRVETIAGREMDWPSECAQGIASSKMSEAGFLKND